jgi:hypothetical protein
MFLWVGSSLERIPYYSLISMTCFPRNLYQNFLVIKGYKGSALRGWSLSVLQLSEETQIVDGALGCHFLVRRLQNLQGDESLIV